MRTGRSKIGRRFIIEKFGPKVYKKFEWLDNFRGFYENKLEIETGFGVFFKVAE